MKVKRYLIVSAAGYTLATADTLAEAKAKLATLKAQVPQVELRIFDTAKAFA